MFNLINISRYGRNRAIKSCYYKCDKDTTNKLKSIFDDSDIRKRIQKLPKLPDYKIHKDHTL